MPYDIWDPPQAGRTSPGRIYIRPPGPNFVIRNFSVQLVTGTYAFLATYMTSRLPGNLARGSGFTPGSLLHEVRVERFNPYKRVLLLACARLSEFPAHTV
jgi:hypothetical protein